MIVWLALFLLVIAISFLLAFRSMRDYQEIPQKSKLEYALYLIRQPANLTTNLLQAIHDNLLKEGLIISLERLFRGSESALCLFGPKDILAQYFQALNLLELEDYTNSVSADNSVIWEVEMKGDQALLKTMNSPFVDLPKLEATELFLWQVILSGGQMQIRAGVVSKDADRRKMLATSLQSLSEGKLVKLPKPFSNDTMLGFYKQRSLDKSTKSEFGSEVLMRLLSMS